LLTWNNDHASRTTAASPCPPAPRLSGCLLDSLLLVFSRFLLDGLLLVFSRFLLASLLLVLSRFLLDGLLLVLSRFLLDGLLLVLSLLLAFSGFLAFSRFLGRDFPCADHLSEGVQLISGARASAGERRQQAA
jgi:hypothetical protein